MATRLAFDAQFYLTQNPDVAAAVSRGQFASAEQHYNLNGRFENRDPNAFFDTSYYLGQYPDVAAARVNPFQHFLQFGSTGTEARFANATVQSAIDTDGNGFGNEFNATAYLAANPDVAAATGPGKSFASAYQHFVVFGQFESRPGTPAGGPFTNTGQAPGAGQTITLTTGVDAITGTAANDTIIGTTGSGATLNVGDQINGGAGTDTLRIVAGAAVPTVNVSNVERIFVQNSAALTATDAVNTATFAGAREFWAQSSTDSIAFSGLNTAQTAGISGTVATGKSVEFQYANVAGTSDAATLALDNANASVVTIAGIETLNVSGNGTVSDLTAANVKTLNVSATAATSITTNASTTATVIDASKSTAGVTINTSAQAASDQTFTGGAGNDKFIVANVTAADKFDGGAGTDTLSVAGGDFRLATSDTLKGLNSATNIEQLEFTGGSATLINGDTFTNSTFSKIVFNGAGADTVELAGARLYAFGADNSGNATFTQRLGSNTLNLALEGAASTAGGKAEVATLTANGASTINIASSGVAGVDANTISSLVVGSNSVINLSGAGDLTISSVSNASAINGATATGKLNITGSAGSDVITGGSGNDILFGGDGVATVVTPASAQVSTLSIGGAIENGDKFTVTIGGKAITVDATSTSAATTASELATAINAQTATTGVSAVSSSSGGLTLTGKADGSAFTLTQTTTESDASTADGQTFTLASTQAGQSAVTSLAFASDTLTGGAGNDTFRFVTGANLTQIDTITDLNLGSNAAAGRVDVLSFDLAQTGTAVAPTIVTLNAGQQTAIANAANFGAAVDAALSAAGTNANAVVQFTYANDTYIAVNGVAGGSNFVAGEDIVVKVTGLTGTLDASDISIV